MYSFLYPSKDEPEGHLLIFEKIVLILACMEHFALCYYMYLLSSLDVFLDPYAISLSTLAHV